MKKGLFLLGIFVVVLVISFASAYLLCFPKSAMPDANGRTGGICLGMQDIGTYCCFGSGETKVCPVGFETHFTEYGDLCESNHLTFLFYDYGSVCCYECSHPNGVGCINTQGDLCLGGFIVDVSGETEVCDKLDNDCDGSIDEGQVCNTCDYGGYGIFDKCIYTLSGWDYCAGFLTEFECEEFSSGKCFWNFGCEFDFNYCNSRLTETSCIAGGEYCSWEEDSITYSYSSCESDPLCDWNCYNCNINDPCCIVSGYDHVIAPNGYVGTCAQNTAPSGTDCYGGLTNKDVWAYRTDYFCNGTGSSSCAWNERDWYSRIEICEYGCENGECIICTPEICDGLDNDCDGGIDENWGDLGTSCTVGVGICQRTGTKVCNVAGTGTTCSATAGTGVAENTNARCDDNLDNDCDTLVDCDDPNCPTNPGDVCYICTSTCSSLGYECGTHTICGVSTPCGPCPSGQVCNPDFECVTPNMFWSFDSYASESSGSSYELPYSPLYMVIENSGFSSGTTVYFWVYEADPLTDDEIRQGTLTATVDSNGRAYTTISITENDLDSASGFLDQEPDIYDDDFEFYFRVDDDNDLESGIFTFTYRDDGAYCGDGVLDSPIEQCDDGNTVSGDGCNANCLWEYCGDGIVNDDGAEECDDGNTVSGDGCSATCHYEYCGDDIVNDYPNEECDYGSQNGVSCDPDYGYYESCTYCSSGCQEVTLWGDYCGDGLCNSGETCGYTNNYPECNDDCGACPIECGDCNIDSPPEQCDDCNTVSGDGCTADCLIEYCGDGTINDVDEECDDASQNGVACDPQYGYYESFDYCSYDCDIITLWGDYCGDGTCNGAEICGNTNNHPECNDDCGLCPAECGNGVLDSPPEECDDGNNENNDGCTFDCYDEYCGDGIINYDLVLGAMDECDDGNSINDDFCSNNCISATCDDGIQNQGEEDIDCGGPCEPCTYPNAFWAENTVLETAIITDEESPLLITPGITTVKMIVTNSGLSVGETADFYIREDDFLGDDNIRTISGSVDSNEKAVGIWTITEADLTAAGDNDDTYEFYFRLNNDNDLESGILYTIDEEEIPPIGDECTSEMCLDIVTCEDAPEVCCNEDNCGVAEYSASLIDPSITCGVDANCGCTWYGGECITYIEYFGDGGVEGGGDPIGRCLYNTNVFDDCSDGGIFSYDWWGTWIWSPENPEHNDPNGEQANCIASSGTISFDCPAEIALPFFGTWGILVTVALIIVIYLVLNLKKSKHKKKSKKKK